MNETLSHCRDAESKKTGDQHVCGCCWPGGTCTAHPDKLRSSINTNRDSLRRQSVQQCGGEPSRKKKPAHLFFDVDAVCHRRDLGGKGQERRTGPSRSGKGGMSEDAEDDSGKPDATRIGCMGESAQASHNFRKARSSTHVVHHRRRIHGSRIRQIFRVTHRGCGDRLRFGGADR